MYALLERLHGHLGWLGLAVLLHPVITLRRSVITRRCRLSVILAAMLISAPSILGWWLYPTYRQQVKPSLIMRSENWALAFETKEHLAWFALVLTWSGVMTVFLAGNQGRRVARMLLGCAFVCGLIVGVLGVLIAGQAHPGWQ